MRPSTCGSKPRRDKSPASRVLQRPGRSSPLPPGTDGRQPPAPRHRSHHRERGRGGRHPYIVMGYLDGQSPCASASIRRAAACLSSAVQFRQTDRRRACRRARQKIVHRDIKTRKHRDRPRRTICRRRQADQVLDFGIAVGGGGARRPHRAAPRCRPVPLPAYWHRDVRKCRQCHGRALADR